MTKSKLRKIYLEKQKSLSDAKREEKSRRIAERFFASFDLKNIRVLHVFVAIEKNREIETAFIYKRLWSEFPEITTIVSRVNFQTMKLENVRFVPETKLVRNKWHIDELRFQLENVRFVPETKLVRNKWHIDEPTDSDLVEIETIDAVLIPLLCFDKCGFRVGYGKGFYDKFLSECRADCLKIGLSYFAPVAEIADAQNFDVKLDFCITPEKTEKFKSAKN